MSPTIFNCYAFATTISVTPYKTSSLLAIRIIQVEDYTTFNLLATKIDKKMSTKAFEEISIEEVVVELKIKTYFWIDDVFGWLIF